MFTWVKREVVGARTADLSHPEAIVVIGTSNSLLLAGRLFRYELHVAPSAARTSAATYSSAWEAVGAAKDALRPSATLFTAPIRSLTLMVQYSTGTAE